MQNAAVLCKTVMKESCSFKLASLKKKIKKERNKLWLFGNFLV